MKNTSPKPTWAQSPIQLAKTFAAVRGYEGREGGWIYNSEGKPVAHGWFAFSLRLQARGWISVGHGIDWILSDGQVVR